MYCIYIYDCNNDNEDFDTGVFYMIVQTDTDYMYVLKFVIVCMHEICKLR